MLYSVLWSIKMRQYITFGQHIFQLQNNWEFHFHNNKKSTLRKITITIISVFAWEGHVSGKQLFLKVSTTDV